MKTIDDFVAILRDELGLPVTVADADRDLDDLPGWDSLHLLWLLTGLERRTGRAVALPDLLEATTLQGIYTLAVAG